MNTKKLLFLITLIVSILFYSLAFAQDKGVYRLSITEAELIEEDDKNFILVKGEANFPDNTQVYVSFKDGLKTDLCYVIKKVNIKESIFNCLLNLSNREVLPGKYIIEARISPSRQVRGDIKTILGPKGENIKEVTEGKLEIDEQTQERIVKANFILTVGSDLEAQIEKEKEKEKEKEALKKVYNGLKPLYNELQKEYTKHQEEFKADGWNTWSNTWLKKVKDLNNFSIINFSSSSKIGFKFSKVSYRVPGICRDIMCLRQNYHDNLYEVPNEERDIYTSMFSKKEEQATVKNLEFSLEEIRKHLGLEEPSEQPRKQ